eukprot:jgi/Mesvir1/11150/Mv04592-RA.1
MTHPAVTSDSRKRAKTARKGVRRHKVKQPSAEEARRRIAENAALMAEFDAFIDSLADPDPSRNSLEGVVPSSNSWFAPEVPFWEGGQSDPYRDMFDAVDAAAADIRARQAAAAAAAAATAATGRRRVLQRPAMEREE